MHKRSFRTKFFLRMAGTDAAELGSAQADPSDVADAPDDQAGDANGDGNGRRIRKGERSRMRILDAAARLLSCRGYAATTLTDIAGAAEMQAGSLYYHFDSKDAIVEEVLSVGIDHARAAIDAALEALGPEARGSDRLAEAIVAYVNCIVAESNFTVANIRCFNESPPQTRESLAVPLREFTNLWVGLLAEGQADGSLRADTNAKVLARIMISGLNSLASWYRPGGELRLEDLARQFADMVLDGLHPAD